jgi:hypothetical protein
LGEALNIESAASKGKDPEIPLKTSYPPIVSWKKKSFIPGKPART